MSTFRVHYAGDLVAETRRDLGFRVITTQALSDFWDGTDLADKHGVYVFTLQRRGPGAAMPFYVGKASKTTFKTESLNKKNRRAFTAALLEGHGTPGMYLVVLQRKAGLINHDAIDDLETLLIWVARHRNPALINRRKIDTSPSRLMSKFADNRVVGVLKAGSKAYSVKKGASTASIVPMMPSLCFSALTLAGNEHFLDSRDERPFTAFSMFDQRRDEVPFTGSRDPQVDAAHPRVDGSVTEAVSPVFALGAALVLLGADEFVELSVDRRLSDLGHQLGKNVVWLLGQDT